MKKKNTNASICMVNRGRWKRAEKTAGKIVSALVVAEKNGLQKSGIPGGRGRQKECRTRCVYGVCRTRPIDATRVEEKKERRNESRGNIALWNAKSAHTPPRLSLVSKSILVSFFVLWLGTLVHRKGGTKKKRHRRCKPHEKSFSTAWPAVPFLRVSIVCSLSWRAFVHLWRFTAKRSPMLETLKRFLRQGFILCNGCCLLSSIRESDAEGSAPFDSTKIEVSGRVDVVSLYSVLE